MSKSILKPTDSGRRGKGVSIPAFEGPQVGAPPPLELQPWAPMGEAPFMQDFQVEMDRIQKDLGHMHRNMMKFPGPGQPMEPMLLPPPPPPPPLTLPRHSPLPQQGLAPLTLDATTPMLPAFPHQGGGTSNGYHGNGYHGHGGGFGTLTVAPTGVPQLLEAPPLPQQPAENGLLMLGGTGGVGVGGVGVGSDGMLPALPMLPPPGPTPVIRDSGLGYQVVELELDVKGFQPEDIHITTDGATLHVLARHVSVKHDVQHAGLSDSKSARQCRRQYVLPDVVRADNLQCYVNERGLLTIEGALGPHLVNHKRSKKKVKFAAPRRH